MTICKLIRHVAMMKCSSPVNNLWINQLTLLGMKDNIIRIHKQNAVVVILTT